MPRLKTFAAVLTAPAILGLIFPPSLAIAATSNQSAAQSTSTLSTSTLEDGAADELVRDVALAPGGILRGQLTDSGGQPQIETRVILSSQNQILVETRTDHTGSFAIQNLRGGVYQIQIGSHSAACRLWAPGTAPPKATEGMLVVLTDDIERGQFARDKFPFGTVQPSKRAVIIGSLIGAGIFVPLYTGRDREPSS